MMAPRLTRWGGRVDHHRPISVSWMMSCGMETQRWPNRWWWWCSKDCSIEFEV